MVLLLGFGLVFLFLLRASLHPRSLVITLVFRSMDFNAALAAVRVPLSMSQVLGVYYQPLCVVAPVREMGRAGKARKTLQGTVDVSRLRGSCLACLASGFFLLLASCLLACFCFVCFVLFCFKVA